MNDRLPPQNLEAEANVIGSMMLDAECIDDVRRIVAPESFYRDTHATLARRIFGLRDAGKPVDTLTVAEELRRHGEYDRIGGDDGLADILRQTPHAANAVFHAQIVAQKASLRGVIETANAMLRDAYAGNLNSDEVQERAESLIFANRDRAMAPKEPRLVRDGIPGFVQALDRREEGTNGVPTGLTAVDDILDGFHPGQLILLGARPSIGKTALALSIAYHASIRAGAKCLVLSMEMTFEEIVSRLVVMGAQVDSHAVRTGRGLDLEMMANIGRATATLQAAETLWVDDSVRLTPEAVMAVARRHKRRHGLDLLIVDYIGLMAPPADMRRSASRNDELTKISGRLKEAAKELRVPIFCLSQLNRENEKRADKKPTMADLRESGALEQDADVVMLMHRPDKYDAADKPGEAFLFIEKNRNGRTGPVRLGFNGPSMTYRDYVEPIGVPYCDVDTF